MAHTKGNWFIDTDYKNQKVIASNFSHIKPMICIIRSEINGAMILEEEAKANDKLIAAAPELLAFIEKYYRFLNLDDQEKAKNLIKKATD